MKEHTQHRRSFQDGFMGFTSAQNIMMGRHSVYEFFIKDTRLFTVDGVNLWVVGVECTATAVLNI